MDSDGDRQELTRGGQVLATKRREYDEDDVRVRPRVVRRVRAPGPGPSTTTPSTASWSPSTGAATPACVDDGRTTSITAMRARELGRKSVVVGDRVGARRRHLRRRRARWPASCGSTSARSVLRRTADDDDTTAEGRLERVVVANADQLVIVSALADPPPRTGFIDRCLVAAYDADIEPLLCLTKADLAGPEEVLGLLRRAGPAVRAVRPDRDLDELRERAAPAGSRSWSGTPGWASRRWSTGWSRTRDRAVGVVSAIGKGRHTSTSAVALRLPPVHEARVRLDHRHPGRPQLRAGARLRRQPAARLPRPGRGHRRLPAELRPHRRRRRLRAGRLGGRRQGRPAPAGLVPPAARLPRPARATRATSQRPARPGEGRPRGRRADPRDPTRRRG